MPAHTYYLQSANCFQIPFKNVLTVEKKERPSGITGRKNVCHINGLKSYRYNL